MAFGAIVMDSPAHRHVMSTLAGRDVAMLLLTLWVMQTRNTLFLSFSFLMHVSRELQDMFIAP